MTVKECLVAARTRIADKQNWFGFDNPRNSDRLCLGLALDRTEPRDPELQRQAYMTLFPAPDFWKSVGRLVDFNDTHTHEEVLAKLDIAIGAL